MGDVVADDLTFIGGDRRQLRGAAGRIAADIDCRVCHCTEKVVDPNASMLLLEAGGIEVESVEIGDATGAIDDAIRLDAALGAGFAEDDPKTPADPIDPLD